MYRKYRKRRHNQSKERFVIILLIASISIGVIAGVMYGLFSKHGSRFLALDYISSLSAASGASTIATDANYSDLKAAVFRESILKYCRTAAIIWLMAFIPIGTLPVIGLIFIRGCGYGLATTLLIKTYRTTGAVYAVVLYMPQALLLIPAYLYMAYRCFSYIINERPRRYTAEALVSSESKPVENKFLYYLSSLLFGCLCCITASAVEAYLIPLLLRRV